MVETLRKNQMDMEDFFFFNDTKLKNSFNEHINSLTDESGNLKTRQLQLSKVKHKEKRGQGEEKEDKNREPPKLGEK